MKVEEKEVTGCMDCPFLNNDNDYGYDACNAPNTKVNLKSHQWEQLPEKGVHEYCPLKESKIIISLKHEI